MNDLLNPHAIKTDKTKAIQNIFFLSNNKKQDDEEEEQKKCEYHIHYSSFKYQTFSQPYKQAPFNKNSCTS